MIGDHHGRMAGRATPLVRTVDEILATHRSRLLERYYLVLAMIRVLLVL
jgi:hypothetical protein